MHSFYTHLFYHLNIECPLGCATCMSDSECLTCWDDYKLGVDDLCHPGNS